MPLSVAAQGSAYLLTQRSWTRRIGTGFRKWSFSRPRFRVVTRWASSSTRRCFITPKRVIGSRPSSALRVCPSCSKSLSSSFRRVGSASALKTASMPAIIGDRMVTCQAVAHDRGGCSALHRLEVVLDGLDDPPHVPGGVADGCVDPIEALLGLRRELDTALLELLACLAAVLGPQDSGTQGSLGDQRQDFILGVLIEGRWPRLGEHQVDVGL